MRIFVAILTLMYLTASAVSLSSPALAKKGDTLAGPGKKGPTASNPGRKGGKGRNNDAKTGTDDGSTSGKKGK